jgi:hypothetical protein
VKIAIFSGLFAAIIWTDTPCSIAQAVPDTSTQTESRGRVLRIESIVPASRDEVWKAFTTSAGLKKWIAPIVSVDLRIGGSLSTNYDKAATIASPGTIRMGILNYLEGEMITFRVTLNDQFSTKVRSEDGNLQEIVQITPLPNGNTKVISSMVG